MALAVIVAVLGLTLSAGVPAPAAAGGVNIVVGGGHRLHSGVGQMHHHTHPPGLRVHPHKHIFFVPRTILVVRSAPSPRWVPGFWTYRWVPQSWSYNVWVPGRWSPEGIWIEGHSEQRIVAGGYYQPVWLGGYWAW